MMSYPLRVRDGILVRVQALPYFAAFKRFSTNKMLQIQPQDLPFCGVYHIQTLMAPDGDANVGEPRFRTSVRIGFSVIILNNDPSAAEYKLDEAFMALTGGLLSDPTLYNNSQFKIQGYVSGAATHEFGSPMADNETPMAELRFELVCDLGMVTYPPVVPDDLETIHVTVGDPQAESMQKIEYEIDQMQQ